MCGPCYTDKFWTDLNTALTFASKERVAALYHEGFTATQISEFTEFRRDEVENMIVVAA